MRTKITCPNGHSQVKNIGSSALSVGTIKFTQGGVTVEISPQESRQGFYKCRRCGVSFSVATKVTPQRS